MGWAINIGNTICQYLIQMSVNNTTVVVVKHDRRYCDGETLTVGSEKWNI
jgi:hypothetical protein